jgi:IclR family acetate operon transcriptional repressor
MSTSTNSADPSSGSQSVDRAITVLEIIAREGSASVSEVATEVGVHRSTISRLLTVLDLRGLVEAAPGRGRYRLGSGILRLASAVGTSLDVTVQGADVAADLAATIGETVNIAVVQGSSAINVHQSEGTGAITANNWVGRPTPLHATSSGKVLLAWLTGSEVEALLGSNLTAFTPATITDHRVLEAELARARSNGYAVTVGELETGLNAIAAPVRAAGGRVIAALSASGPAYRLPPPLLDRHSAAVIAAANRLADRMGYLA